LTISSTEGIACGNKKVAVPWGSLSGKETEYVDEEYLPEGFYFKEPSKMVKADVYTYLKFWFRRQEDPRTETVFEFKRIKGKDGEPVGLRVSTTNQRKQVAKRGPRKTGPKKKGSAKTREDSSEREQSGDIEDDQSEDEDDDEEGPEEDNEDDDKEDPEVDGDGQGSDGLAPPLPLPFGAVPRKGWMSGQSISRKRPTKKRNEPATGPQFDRPNTRRRKQRDDDLHDDHDESPPRKKKKTRVPDKKGPPVGVAPDKVSSPKRRQRK
jgi:hypothetical protein